MNRNFFCDVIILSSRIFGEDNRIFTVLSHEYGVFDAVLYGGRKSKLRSMCSPYHCGKMWFYRDEKRKSIKITDFDVVEYHLSIRENLYKTYAAALCSELVIKTKNGHHQDDLQTQYTGGTVLHLYMNERISSSDACKNFVRRVLENYRLPYVSISPVYSICPKHGYLNGEHKFCPLCDQELIERKRKELEAV